MRTTIVSNTILTTLLFSTSLIASPVLPSFIISLNAWVIGKPFNSTMADLPKTSPDFIDFLHRHLPLTTKLELVAEHNIPMNHHDYPPKAMSSRTTVDITGFEHLFVNETLLKHQSLQLCDWLPSTQAFSGLPFLPPNATALAAAIIHAQKLCMKTLGGKVSASGVKSMRKVDEKTEEKTHMQVFLYQVLEMAKQLMIVHPGFGATTSTNSHINTTAGLLNATASATSQNGAALLFEEVQKEVRAHSSDVVKGPSNRVLCAVFASWCREEVRELGGWVVDLKDFTAGRGEMKNGV